MPVHTNLHSAPHRVEQDQQDDSAYHCHEQTVHVQACDARFAKVMEQPAADHRADDPEQNIDDHSVATVVHQVTRDESSQETENDPRY
jgi:ribonuclease HII